MKMLEGPVEANRIVDVPGVICSDPGSLLVTLMLDGKVTKMWMCIPHFAAQMRAGHVLAPLPDKAGKFMLQPGEVACAHTTNCRNPIGGGSGAYVIKEAMSNRHLIVCKEHHDLRTTKGRGADTVVSASFGQPLDAPGGSPPITRNGTL